MLYISYRGLFNGEDPSVENTPEQIAKAFGRGLGCMVDAWRVDNKIYLGSNLPLNEVTPVFLKGNKFWINARNNDMYTWLKSHPST